MNVALVSLSHHPSLALRALIVAPLMALSLAGCSGKTIDASLDSGFKKLFQARKTPQQQMLVAVSSEDPDARREATIEVSKSKLYDREWAIKGFIAIALLESDAQTRCIAIRALGRTGVATGEPRATETMLKILNYREYPPQEVWPPVPIARWDATAALADLAAVGKIPEDQREAVRKTLIERLRSDGERQTRVAAARGLANYRDADTVKMLIGGLRDDDFAVVYTCEDSLVKLTGVTHHADVVEWETWLAANQDSEFAHAGEIPDSRKPPYKNGVEKMAYDTRQLFNWLWPGKKEN